MRSTHYIPAVILLTSLILLAGCDHNGTSSSDATYEHYADQPTEDQSEMEFDDSSNVTVYYDTGREPTSELEIVYGPVPAGQAEPDDHDGECGCDLTTEELTCSEEVTYDDNDTHNVNINATIVIVDRAGAPDPIVIERPVIIERPVVVTEYVHHYHRPVVVTKIVHVERKSHRNRKHAGRPDGRRGHSDRGDRDKRPSDRTGRTRQPSLAAAPIAVMPATYTRKRATPPRAITPTRPRIITMAPRMIRPVKQAPKRRPNAVRTAPPKSPIRRAIPVVLTRQARKQLKTAAKAKPIAVKTRAKIQPKITSNRQRRVSPPRTMQRASASRPQAGGGRSAGGAKEKSEIREEIRTRISRQLAAARPRRR